MLFPLRGEEPPGADLLLWKVESGPNQSETCLQNEVWRDLLEIFSNFVFRVVERDLGDNSKESLALVITVGLVAGLALTMLTLALVTLIRSNIEDSKSRAMNTVLSG